MKNCLECKLPKSLDEYYKHPKMADGHLNKCKQCVRSRVSRHRDENLEEIRAYDRNRNKTDKRKKSHLAKQKKGRKTLHYQVRVKTNNAIRDGRIVRQPCEICGDLESEAHHTDYNIWDQIKWLCRKHHEEEHGVRR